jgi:adenine/guanine phosphoribosyltransferase-like PRPP-binding protein
MHHTVITSYLTRVLDPDKFRESIDLAAEKLRDIEFDAIAVTGNSGVSFGAALAYKMGKALLIVRKKTENCHSIHTVEGSASVQRFIIVDDCIASGCTWRRVYDATMEFLEKRNTAPVKYVTTLLYGDSMFSLPNVVVVPEKWHTLGRL